MEEARKYCQRGRATVTDMDVPGQPAVGVQGPLIRSGRCFFPIKKNMGKYTRTEREGLIYHFPCKLTSYSNMLTSVRPSLFFQPYRSQGWLTAEGNSTANRKRLAWTWIWHGPVKTKSKKLP